MCSVRGACVSPSHCVSSYTPYSERRYWQFTRELVPQHPPLVPSQTCFDAPQATAPLYFPPPPSSKYSAKHTYAVNLVCRAMPTTCLVLAELHHVKQNDPNKDVNWRRTHIRLNKHESLYHRNSCDMIQQHAVMTFRPPTAWSSR